MDVKSKSIICIAYGKGKQHDFKIWKRSLTKAKKSIKQLGEKGYQGIKKYQANSQTPIKKKRGKNLDRESKKINQKLARERIIIEHINRRLKIFKLLSSRYRNRRRRINLRLSLIAGIYNYGLNCRIKNTISL